jgi:hypothetical protein
VDFIRPDLQHTRHLSICIAVSLQYCNWRYQELVDPYMSISDSLNSVENCDLTKGNINREGDETIFFLGICVTNHHGYVLFVVITI